MLSKLAPEQLVEFVGWLAADETYAAIRAKLKARFGVEISEHGISDFWRKYYAPAANERDEFIRGVVREQLKQRPAAPANAS